MTVKIVKIILNILIIFNFVSFDMYIYQMKKTLLLSLPVKTLTEGARSLNFCNALMLFSLCLKSRWDISVFNNFHLSPPHRPLLRTE